MIRNLDLAGVDFLNSRPSQPLRKASTGDDLSQKFVQGIPSNPRLEENEKEKGKTDYDEENETRKLLRKLNRSQKKLIVPPGQVNMKTARKQQLRNLKFAGLEVLGTDDGASFNFDF